MTELTFTCVHCVSIINTKFPVLVVAPRPDHILDEESMVPEECGAEEAQTSPERSCQLCLETKGLHCVARNSFGSFANL